MNEIERDRKKNKKEKDNVYSYPIGKNSLGQKRLLVTNALAY
jgi:hypothetical protein